MDTKLKITMAPVFVLLASILWGTTGTAQALAPDLSNPLTVGAARITIGAVTMLLITLYRGTLKLDKSWPIVATLLSALGITAYQLLFFTAVSKTGVAIGTVVTMGSAPVIAGFLALVVRKEKPEKKWYYATIISIIGMLLLFDPSNGEKVNSSGILLAVGAGLAYAVYALASKQLLEKHSPDVILAVLFSISAILLSPLLLIYETAWLMEPRGILVALHLGFFATALAYFLFSSGLAVLPVSTAVSLTLAEPLTATFLGIVLIGERLILTSYIGLTLLLTGLIILSVRRKSFKSAQKKASF